MTALEQYQRLEAEGLWRSEAQGEQRPVIVSFGNATLVLSDPRSETPLSHWSLPAVVRLNPGQRPARYAPDAEGADEELQITDGEMIAAIDKVHRAIRHARPHPGRLRGSFLVVAAVTLAGVAVWWLPTGLPRYAARIAPPAQQVAIGGAVLADMARSTGPVCSRPAGEVVARRLGVELLGKDGRLVVLPEGFTGARALPGGIVAATPALLSRGEEQPAVVAGYILAASVDADSPASLERALTAAGVLATMRLLTRGSLPADAVAGYGAHVIQSSDPRPDDDLLLSRFARAEVSSEPYARDIDPSGEAALGLIEADPLRGDRRRTPALTVAEWRALAGICAE